MKKKILFVVPSLSRAGAEAQLVDLLLGFDENKFDKSLVVFGANIDQLDKLSNSNINFYHWPRKSKTDFFLVTKLARLIEKEKIDVIHCTLNVSMFFVRIASRLSKRKPKIVSAVHTTINRSSKEELWERFVYSRMLTKCDKVIFVCQKQAEHWRNKYSNLNDNSIVIHNGIDVGYYRRTQSQGQRIQSKKKYGIPQDGQVLCCIAAFRPEKGHLMLLDAFSKLQGEPHLILAGDGLLRAALEAKIKELNLSSRVHMTGNIDDVRAVLELADISVLASTAVETFSIAMLESMAMSVPVVCSNIGGLSEAVIPGKTGELVAIGDLNDLVEKLQKVLSNNQSIVDMSVNTRNLVENKFSKELMISKTENLISNLFMPGPL